FRERHFRQLKVTRFTLILRGISKLLHSRKTKRTIAMKIWRCDQLTPDDCFVDKDLPLYLSISVVVIYLLFCSWIISFCDYYDGMKQGLSYFDAFYYSFQSLATIGLGDVVPNNIKYNPFVSLMIIFGLALLSLVNGTVYRKVERKFLACIDRFESWLQTLRIQRPLPEGYIVFRHLSPNIQLLAFALPIFDNMEEANIHEMLDPRNTKVGRWAFADQIRSRSTTLPTAQPPHTATLGIFATTSTKARSTTFSNYHSTCYGCNTSNWKISAISGPINGPTSGDFLNYLYLSYFEIFL
uniref:Potassium channel domain-containing protein n=1 Tax=Parascaris univalens TaxID=6257 RepID=A0A915B7H2_PARUN